MYTEWLKNNIKYIVVGLLVVQNASVNLLTRYSKGIRKEEYSITTAILCIEILKFVISITLSIYYTKNWREHLAYLFKHSYIMIIPAMIYNIQNSLVFLALIGLTVDTYAVLSQLKLVTTSILSRIFLGKQISWKQWESIGILFMGIVLVQYICGCNETKLNTIYGYVFALSVAVLSGLAGVYFEYMLKKRKETVQLNVWDRNVQLSFYSILISSGRFLLVDVYLNRNFDPFHGYSWFTILIILSQAMGGLLVAVVVKHTSTILKGFATGISIIITVILSIILFNNHMNFVHWIGTILVFMSVVHYIQEIPKTPIEETSRV